MRKLVLVGIVVLAALVGVAAPASAAFEPIAYFDRTGDYASCVVDSQSPYFVVYCGTPPLP